MKRKVQCSVCEKLITTPGCYVGQHEQKHKEQVAWLEVTLPVDLTRSIEDFQKRILAFDIVIQDLILCRRKLKGRLRKALNLQSKIENIVAKTIS